MSHSASHTWPGIGSALAGDAPEWPSRAEGFHRALEEIDALMAESSALDIQAAARIRDVCARLKGAVQELEETRAATAAAAAHERRAREAAADRFYRLFHGCPFAMSIASLEDGRILDINPIFTERTGYTREDVVGKTSLELGLWDDPPGREWLLEDLRTKGVVQGREIRVVSKSGARRYTRFHAHVIHLDGKPYIVGLSEPQDEHLRAEEAIARLKRFYEEVLNDLPAEVAVFDTECRYVYLTPSCVRDAAMRKWIIHKTDYDYCCLMGMDVSVAYRRHTWLREVIASREIGRFEETFTGPDGQVRHFIRMYNPVFAGEDEVTHVISYGIDVTDLKRLEEQFNQAQKMEAVGRLAGGIAHDFNNLLTAIIGTTELMLGHHETHTDCRRGLEEIKRAADRAASLTRQLLAFSRRQVLQPTVLNLNKVVTGMETILRRLIGEQICFITDLDPALAHVKADSTQFEQVLMNLAVNARDAMPERGTLTIRTANVTLPPGEVPAPLAAFPPPYVLLEVRDTGCGIAPEILEHIFEPFFTTKEEGRGTGLGLSTVYAIVDRAGGHVVVESEPGKGASFRVYLPRSTDAVPATLPKLATEPASKGTETVLLVEDEDAVRHVVRRILELNGYRVLQASDGVEALEVAARHEAPIELLLSDVVMPRMSGRELAEQIKIVRPDIQVLFMSGHTDDVTVHHIAVHQRMAFIQKPFSASALAGKIREVLESRSQGR